MELIAVILILVFFIWAENILYGRFWLKKLEYRCYFSESEVNEGDEIELVEEVTNGKLLPIAWMKSELTTSRWLEFAQLQSSVADKSRFVSSFFMMKSYHRVSRRWKVKCTRRGVYKIDMAVIVASNLFGNMNLSMPVNKEHYSATVRVLPKPAQTERISSGSKMLMGDSFVRFCAVSDPFFRNGVRDYTPQDSMKQINWKTTARQQSLAVFTNDFTESRRVAVILNMQSRDYEINTVYNEDILERCISLCAKLFCECSEENVPYCFMSNTSVSDDGKTPVISEKGTGDDFTISMLRLLSDIKMMSTATFAVFLQNTLPYIDATDIFVVTAFISDEIISLLPQDAKIVLAGPVGEVETNGLKIIMPEFEESENEI